MFSMHDKNGYKEVLPDIRMKPLVYGDKTMMTEFILQKGSVLQEHNHLHEQTGYLVSGRMILTIGEETFEVEPGDSWNIPADVPHRASIIEDSVAIEVFYPRRDEYLD